MSGSGRPGGESGRVDSLQLRPWAESDAPGLRDAIDEDVGHLKPWLSWSLEEPATLERTEDRVRGWVSQFRAGKAFRYAITPLDRPLRILGGAHLSCRVGPGAHDIGYWVRSSATRQGIAAAAVSSLAIHAFDQRKAGRLVLQCDVANTASAAFARAIGFRFTGPVTTTYPDGSARPVLRFEMSVEDYTRHHMSAFRDRARRVHLVPGPVA